MVKGFLKIFQNLENYSFEGGFEGWMRRIMINECLMELRKNKIFHLNALLLPLAITSQYTSHTKQKTAFDLATLLHEYKQNHMEKKHE